MHLRFATNVHYSKDNNKKKKLKRAKKISRGTFACLRLVTVWCSGLIAVMVKLRRSANYCHYPAKSTRPDTAPRSNPLPWAKIEEEWAGDPLEYPPLSPRTAAPS
jgi:hypothetical protein